MRLEICTVVIILAGFGVAEEYNQPPAMSLIGEVPPAIPQEQKASQQTPPDQKIQPSEELSTPEVQRLIKDGLRYEPALANANLNVKVDDSSVWLTGTVDDEKRHDLALRIAESYSGRRQIFDRIRVARTELKTKGSRRSSVRPVVC
jgi:BON domain